MSQERESAALSWALPAIARKWPGIETLSTSALKHDLSSRRFWRVTVASKRRRTPESVVIVDLGPDDVPAYARALAMYPKRMPEPPWVNVHRFLKSLGAPVPELFDWSPSARALVVEDVGSRALRQAVAEAPSNCADLYREAVRELVRLHVEGTRRTDGGCVAFRVAYDERLFAWEMEEFVEYGLTRVSPGTEAPALRDDLASLARRLGCLPRVFSHRDFHGNNLFVQGEDRIRIIDFQDALMAPAAQDLAVLLTTRDTDEFITQGIETRLLDFYYTSLLRAGEPTLAHHEFLTSYRLCVLQHALKVIGRFVHAERQGRTGYTRYLPHALGQARRMLAELGGEFPRLRAALAPEQ